MKILQCDDEGLAAAAAILNSGGVVVIPTDTVYGLAAHPSHAAAVERLYTIKGREAKKPIAMLASDITAVTNFGCALPPRAHALAQQHWPGALTLVLPYQNTFEGVRIPNHSWTRRLIAQCGGMLRVTSANLSGQRAATDAPQALKDVGLSADLIIDDGISPGGTASTVVKIDVVDTLTVLRPGPIQVS